MSPSLKGKSVLITAGPTREYIDPVRFISNDSSGRMGFALAEAAIKLKACVTLIHGHITGVPPKGVGRLKGGHARGIRRISVVSAQDMFAAVKKYYKQADIIIMAAAVADWRPIRCSGRKIKKDEGRRTKDEFRTIELVPNPDILTWLGKHKRPRQILVGFALETEDIIKNATAKLHAKKCDFIVANSAKVIGKDKTSIFIINKHDIVAVNNKNKAEAAKRILKRIYGGII